MSRNENNVSQRRRGAKCVFDKLLTISLLAVYSFASFLCDFNYVDLRLRENKPFWITPWRSPTEKSPPFFPRLLPIPFPYLRRTCAVHASYLSRTCVGESRLFYVKYPKHDFCRPIYGLHTAKVRRKYG